MTTVQKQRILDMQKDGFSFSQIAESLGLPKNTVKTFYWRIKKSMCDASEDTGIEENQEKKNQCKYCKALLEQRPKQKPRCFCDDACRLAWWKENRESLNRKAIYTLVCTHCKENFNSYGNKGRKYCSHKCYITARFGIGNRKAVAEI